MYAHPSGGGANTKWTSSNTPSLIGRNLTVFDNATVRGSLGVSGGMTIAGDLTVLGNILSSGGGGGVSCPEECQELIVTGARTAPDRGLQLSQNWAFHTTETSIDIMYKITAGGAFEKVGTLIEISHH
jgi:hypothetical protein